jgi:membrane associated rhomboid family serine protease
MVLPRLTPVTRRLLVIHGAVYFASFVLFLVSKDVYAMLSRFLRLAPADWIEFFPFVPAWQLVTYGFLHDVLPYHILGNLLMLYFFGTMLEEMLGSRRFVVTYVGAQLAGALFFLIPGVTGWTPRETAIGASGAVYGVMIATATLRPRQTVFLLFIPITLQVLALFILGITLIHAALSLFGQGVPSDGVAHLVHLGGIAYGFVAVRLGWVNKDPWQSVRRRRAVADVERAAADEARVDQLLEKIHREGMGALSRREREFLKRVSRK